MITHLTTCTLRHWDPHMRQLGARALSALMPVIEGPVREWVMTSVIDMLVGFAMDVSLEVL